MLRLHRRLTGQFKPNTSNCTDVSINIIPNNQAMLHPQINSFLESVARLRLKECTFLFILYTFLTLNGSQCKNMCFQFIMEHFYWPVHQEFLIQNKNQIHVVKKVGDRGFCPKTIYKINNINSEC